MKGDLSRGFKFLRQQWKTGIVLSSQVILPNQFNHVNFVTIAITPHQSYLINFYLLCLRKLKDHEKNNNNWRYDGGPEIETLARPVVFYHLFNGMFNKKQTWFVKWQFVRHYNVLCQWKKKPNKQIFELDVLKEISRNSTYVPELALMFQK